GQGTADPATARMRRPGLLRARDGTRDREGERRFRARGHLRLPVRRGGLRLRPGARELDAGAAVKPGLRSKIDIRTVDRDTIRLSGTGNHVLDVLFDGARVWSFHVPRDVKATGDGEVVVSWPRMMRRYLTGHTTVTVRAHVSGQVLFER